MRRARLTYPGAYHHVMNRGIRGEHIFPDERDKNTFLKILDLKAKLLGVRVFGYCVMNNHYHLLLENGSGRMSDLLKQVNGSYGIYYRRNYGGKGYVFQSRFKSTLIQDDSYLQISILYLLQNPVRAGLVTAVGDYKWSSAGEYLGKTRKRITDVQFVHELWGNKKNMQKEIFGDVVDELPIKKSDHGDLLGGDEFMETALIKRDRRSEGLSTERRRKEDGYFEPVDKVYWELERKNGMKFEAMDFGTFEGKRKRGELLVALKEMCGLTYREISGLPEFSGLKSNSLSKLYGDALKRISSD